MTRTYPDHRKFSRKTQAGQKGQAQLYNVLRAYAAYDQELGYCQGMNFVAGMFVIYLDSEEKAFGSLVLIMKERSLRDFYTQDLEMLQVSGCVGRRLSGSFGLAGAWPSDNPMLGWAAGAGKRPQAVQMSCRKSLSDHISFTAPYVYVCAKRRVQVPVPHHQNTTPTNAWHHFAKAQFSRCPSHNRTCHVHAMRLSDKNLLSTKQL